MSNCHFDISIYLVYYQYNSILLNNLYVILTYYNPPKSGQKVHFQPLAQKLKMYGRFRFRNNV